MNIPIVIAAFNRGHALERLLYSLDKAYYAGSVKLIISIDGGGGARVKRIAEEFDWQYGQKEIIVNKDNLGLRNHILSCGDLTSQYDGIVLLEDDLYVSPWFYHYTISTQEYYKNCSAICGVSLYSYQYNETALFPFKPINDGTDVYFMQLPCSWGQSWLKEHWQAFRCWYKTNFDTKLQYDSSLPPNISFWPDTSWKKFFLKYMVEVQKYFVYPRNSYTTNFGDKGQHHQGTNVFQVPLVFGSYGDYRFIDFDNGLVKYDAFCELLPECLRHLSSNLLPVNLSVDLYGSKRRENFTNEYVVTSKPCRSYISSFGMRVLPPELNIINVIEGNDFFLARTDQLEDVGDINMYLYSRTIDRDQQKYFFGTDDVHYARLREAESRLVRVEAAHNLLPNNIDLASHLQHLTMVANEAEARVHALERSLSWRITRPLRWLGDKLLATVKSWK